MNNLKICKHSANIVAILLFFKLGTIKYFYQLELYCLFDHAHFLKLITVLNKFPKCKHLDLNFRDCRYV